MSTITLVQIAEKPMMVTIEDAISSFADSLQGRLAMPLRRPNLIVSLPVKWDALRMVAAGLNGPPRNDNALTFRCLRLKVGGGMARPRLKGCLALPSPDFRLSPV
jgi:hypothetical protein